MAEYKELECAVLSDSLRNTQEFSIDIDTFI